MGEIGGSIVEKERWGLESERGKELRGRKFEKEEEEMERWGE